MYLNSHHWFYLHSILSIQPIYYTANGSIKTYCSLFKQTVSKVLFFFQKRNHVKIQVVSLNCTWIYLFIHFLTPFQHQGYFHGDQLYLKYKSPKIILKYSIQVFYTPVWQWNGLFWLHKSVKATDLYQVEFHIPVAKLKVWANGTVGWGIYIFVAMLSQQITFKYSQSWCWAVPNFKQLSQGFNCLDPYILVPQCLRNKDVMVVYIVQTHRSWASGYMGIIAPEK